MKAVWKETVLADSDATLVVEGNHYFPPGAVKAEHLQPSETRTNCPSKGLASYYNIRVDGEVNADAAWFYPDPKSVASEIKDHVAFWKGVRVID